MRAALLDTSVLVEGRAFVERAVAGFDEVAISAVSVGELTYGLVAAGADWERRFARQARCEWVRRTFVPLPLDTRAAVEYGRIRGLLSLNGRRGGARSLDLMFAATARANGMALITRDADDLRGAESLVEIVAV